MGYLLRSECPVAWGMQEEVAWLNIRISGSELDQTSISVPSDSELSGRIGMRPQASKQTLATEPTEGPRQDFSRKGAGSCPPWGVIRYFTHSPLFPCPFFLCSVELQSPAHTMGNLGKRTSRSELWLILVHVWTWWSRLCLGTGGSGCLVRQGSVYVLDG